MWGGWVTVPPYCTAVITLSWYTPNEAAPGRKVDAGQSPYQLLVQRQSGTFKIVDVTITPASDAAAQGKQQVTYHGTLGTNTLISLRAVNCSNAQACG